MLRNTPLVYFFGIVPGRYEAIWPVFVVGDDPDHLTFTVVAEDRAFAHMDGTPTEPGGEARRRYVTTLVQRRLHQQAFRERVLLAYRETCGICRLRHRELLDAAHILPDRHPRGEPMISNGLALCTLHHAAFDRQVLGVRPDLVVEVRRDILREAARLRALIPGLRTPDAIHAATSAQHGCALFVSNDAGFRRVPALPLAILDDVLAAS